MGFVPPLRVVAVKLMLVPVQMEVCEAIIEMEGVTGVDTFIIIELLVADTCETQAALDVKSHVTFIPLVNVVEV